MAYEATCEITSVIVTEAEPKVAVVLGRGVQPVTSSGFNFFVHARFEWA